MINNFNNFLIIYLCLVLVILITYWGISITSKIGKIQLYICQKLQRCKGCKKIFIGTAIVKKIICPHCGISNKFNLNQKI